MSDGFSMPCDFETLKRRAVEFLKELPALDVEGCEGGWHGFSLSYIGCSCISAAEEIQSVALFRFVAKKYERRMLCLIHNDT